MFEEIVNSEINIDDLQDLTDDCRHLILGLLEKDPSKRIGSQGGFEEILHHPFFQISGLTVEEYWQAVYNKYIPPPPILVPDVERNYEQEEPFALTNFEESSKMMTTIHGDTFENYSEGNGATNSFLNTIETENTTEERLITYEDLMTEEDNQS